MSVDLTNFLHSLATAIAAAAGLSYANAPRSLWIHGGIEADSNDPWTVLRIYGGPGTAWDNLPRASVQVETVGSVAGVVLGRAQQIYETLQSSEGRPWQGKVINGYKASDGTADGTWKIVSIEFNQRPGIVAQDATRTRAVFNVEIGFAKAS